MPGSKKRPGKTSRSCGLKGSVPRGKIGLALGSGVARGLAHIGVLKVLEEEGIDIDMVAGTSIGAVVGALLARGYGADQMKELARKIGSRRLSLLTDFTLPRTGLIRGRRIEKTLKSIFGDAEISDLKKPFACVATDIDTGEKVVIDRGPVRDALRASISLPVVMAVVKRQGRFIVDGFLVDPVPVDVLRAMGADFIIAVNVIPDQRTTEETAEPNIFHIIMHTLNIVSYHTVKTSLAGADIVIEPAVEKIGLTDFHRVDEMVSIGELAARKALPEIKSRLGDIVAVSGGE